MRCGFLGGSDQSLVLGGYGEFPLVVGHPWGGLYKQKFSSAVRIESKIQIWEPLPLGGFTLPKREWIEKRKRKLWERTVMERKEEKPVDGLEVRGVGGRQEERELLSGGKGFWKLGVGRGPTVPAVKYRCDVGWGGVSGYQWI